MAGKTDHIINIYNKYSSIGKKILLINHQLDLSRTENKNIVRSHDQNHLPALVLKKLENLNNVDDFQESEIIIIDEGQFFEDLYPFIKKELVKFGGKVFYVFGLNGDVKMEKIGQIIDLVPLADKITHFTSLCNFCSDGTEAPFTLLKKEFKEQIEKGVLVGDKKKFVPVCRFHYLRNS
jgi:thymidine kinase